MTMRPLRGNYATTTRQNDSGDPTSVGRQKSQVLSISQRTRNPRGGGEFRDKVSVAMSTNDALAEHFLWVSAYKVIDHVGQGEAHFN